MFDGVLRWMLGGGLFCLLGLVVAGPAFGQPPLTDPTRPGILSGGVARATEEKPGAWTLTSTLIAPQRRVAVINDQLVQVGQAVDGATLIAVEPGSALLRRGGKQIRLTLVAASVKRAAKPAP